MLEIVIIRQLLVIPKYLLENAEVQLIQPIEVVDQQFL